MLALFALRILKLIFREYADDCGAIWLSASKINTNGAAARFQFALSEGVRVGGACCRVAEIALGHVAAYEARVALRR